MPPPHREVRAAPAHARPPEEHAMTIAARIHAARDLRLEQEAAPELGPHDVELRLGAGGICGSDLHYFQHGRVGAFTMREPLIPGHEASGVVARLGAGGDARRGRRQGRDQPVASVRPLRLLQRRPPEPVPQHALPRQRQRVPARPGHVPRALRDGRGAADADRRRTSRSASWPAPSRCRSACMPCTAPATCCGRTVLITGGGTIGCMSVLAARLAGAAKVIVCDIAERPLEMARAGRRRSRAALRPGRRRAN